MDVLYPVCCGLDVHKKTITACLRFPSARARAEEVRTFGTTTRELLRLADWLTAAGCTHVAMESTGVYWRPVYHILEASFEVLLVNAQHVKAVPGRKTDVKDCQWLAQLLEHGLLRGSFVPPAPLRELRELTRYRRQLVQEHAREANRVQKVLETANIKLGDVATDVLGVSGRAMLHALIAGERDPERLADLARGARRQAPQRAHAQRQRLAAFHAGRVRTGRGAESRLLSQRSIPCVSPTARRQEGHCRGWSLHPRRRMAHPARRRRIPRPGT